MIVCEAPACRRRDIETVVIGLGEVGKPLYEILRASNI